MVIIPLVENEVVLRYGWLTQREFIDAITLGQITPGPVVISATFIGYRVAGFIGAVVSTICVILPSFTMVCLATEGIKKFKENKMLQNFFHGARAAIIGMIFEVGLSIGRSSIETTPGIGPQQVVRDYWSQGIRVYRGKLRK